MPRIGLGTWRMGESAEAKRSETAAVRHAIDAGLTLIDTAEMYGDGGAEKIVGQAIQGARERVFLVSKVYPWNASAEGTIDACEQSLRRLKTEVLDLYLLHWRGEHPLADTVAAFERLVAAGKIRRWGVSNFDTADMIELAAVAAPGACAVNQVYYNAAKRWPEASLQQHMRETGIVCMAYSPLDQGRLLRHPAVKRIAARIGISAAQVALAWLMRMPDVVPIPKSSRTASIDDFIGAAALNLSAEDVSVLDQAFPPPGPAAGMETT